jgi:endonuclease G, mitochondrial
MIGEKDNNGISIPVPSHFYKCILTEEKNGSLKMWAFEMENSALTGTLSDYLVTTAYIEQRAGMLIWGNLTGPEIEKEKNKVRKLWG